MEGITTKFNREMDLDNIEAIVSDNDGTAYSIANYIPRLMNYLAQHIGKGEKFKEDYYEKERGLIIGQTYSGKDKEVFIRNGWWLPASIFIGDGYGDFSTLKSLFMDGFYKQVIIPSMPERIFFEMLENNLYKIMISGNDNNQNMKQFLENIGILDYFDRVCSCVDYKDKPREALRLLEEVNIQPHRTIWLEDDLGVLRSAKDYGFITVLRKVRGRKYNPIRFDYVDIEVDDDFDELGKIIK